MYILRLASMGTKGVVTFLKGAGGVLILWLCATCRGTLDADFNIPKGWRMEDRFYGFRFEAHGHVQGVQYKEAAQVAADELGCFGWVQDTQRGTVVGEARCSIPAGGQMVDRLRVGSEESNVSEVVVKRYKDTKIKLHFSHFKILVPRAPT
ncbi:unnamed protein product [Discosporangium mesarthrocarpum]